MVQSSDMGDLKQETQSMVIFLIRNDSSVRFLNMNISGVSKHNKVDIDEWSWYREWKFTEILLQKEHDFTFRFRYLIPVINNMRVTLMQS